MTYGDAIHINNGNYSILSGDVIMTMIAKTLNPSRVIFAVNTDGVYKNRETERLSLNLQGAISLIGGYLDPEPPRRMSPILQGNGSESERSIKDFI